MGMNMHKHTAIVSSKTYRHNSDHRQSTTPKNDAIPGPTSEKRGVGEGKSREALVINVILTCNCTTLKGLLRTHHHWSRDHYFVYTDLHSQPGLQVVKYQH